MSVRVFAPAKINLTLEVGRPRSDGYHPLQSVVMFADVGDVVEATPADSLSLTISGEFSADIIADESNLVLRAAHAFAEAAKIDRPCARLVLEKNLPVASGIGGGSADAAAALRALNELWGLNWPLAQLHPIALRLGADAPVCLAGVPAYMTGVGEIFTPVSASSIAAVLANPLKPLPTPAVYRRFDAMGLGGAFTERRAPSWPDAAAACADIATIGNDLAAPAESLMADIALIRAELSADPRVLYAGMSGSGATMFALLAHSSDAEALAESLQMRRPEWWVADTILAGA